MVRVGTSTRDEDQASRERFELLFRANHGRVARYVARRTRPELVDDVVAETFLVAWRRLHDVPPDSLPWLLGTARRALATQERSTRRRLALAKRVAFQPARSEEQPTDLAGSVVEALHRLRPGDREAITLIAWEGLLPAQAARALGQTEVAFRVRLHRARRRLARELERDLLPVSQALVGPIRDDPSEC